jgi:anaerobic magnesium-protoporphyrin IX monomethyl ester cyclase
MNSPISHEVSANSGTLFSHQSRDTSRPVMLIGFQEQTNLGLGYLASTLRQHGYRAEILDFEQSREEILRAAQELNPVVIGFSLIFQFYVERFEELASYLRRNGISCHFTMGGHYPSLSYQQALELVPPVDSAVLFEGELTLLELVDRISLGLEWRGIDGIAYRQESQVVANPLRALVRDLDDLPYPDRDQRPMSLLGRRVAPMLASRGCIRTCSFCSIHVFYRTAPGKVVRTRNPVRVVEEMKMLHEREGITIFLFQDDDFPLYGPVWRRWANDFVDALHAAGLAKRIIWKINCRADAVEPELMTRMRDAGLYLVYMGLESGSSQGLTTLHKGINVEQNLRAVKILKELDIMFEYGFMLFDPSSTFESVQENLEFLRTIVSDGSSAASFCRMVPYDGTPIKDELAKTGRLKGDVLHPNYDFLDPRLDALFYDLNQMVHVSGWIHGIGALTPQLQYAKAEIAAMRGLFPPLEGLAQYNEKLKEITQAANEFLFDVVQQVWDSYCLGVEARCTPESIREACLAFQRELLEERNSFVAGQQSVLLQALSRETALEPSLA